MGVSSSPSVISSEIHYEKNLFCFFMLSDWYQATGTVPCRVTDPRICIFSIELLDPSPYYLFGVWIRMDPIPNVKPTLLFWKRANLNISKKIPGTLFKFCHMRRKITFYQFIIIFITDDLTESWDRDPKEDIGSEHEDLKACYNIISDNPCTT